jgi:anti-anti-sigma regulatory factor
VNHFAVAPPVEVIELAAQLTIAQVDALHDDLKRRAAAGHALMFDGARVEQIDTAVLQLLVSAWHTCEQRGTACRWTAASDALRRSAALIGVADLLKLPAT